MTKNKKTILLAIIFWLLTCGFVSRIDKVEYLSLYIQSFLDMMFGASTAVLSIVSAYHFIKPDEDE